MNTAPQYATRTVTIPAGATVEIVRTATFVTVLNADAPFKVRFDNNPAFDLEKGLTLRTPVGFNRIELTNTGASPNTVTLGLGRGDVNDARLVISGQIDTTVASGQIDTRETMPDVLHTGAPVTTYNTQTTLVAAARARRREIILVNTGAATVYIGGDASAAVAEGLPLLAAQSLTLETTAAVYCRNDTGGQILIAVAETEVSA